MTNSVTPKFGDFAPSTSIPTGFERIYTGQIDLSAVDTSAIHLTYAVDADGNVTIQYSLWGFAYTAEARWTDEIRAINRMQAGLDPLDDATRTIRAQIASLVPCDNGFPVTVDEMLNAIGTGVLPEPAFHAGCWLSRGGRGTQPGQVESMRAIEAVLHGYLEGQPEAAAVAQYPQAAGFVRRAYEWLGPVAGLGELQTLMLRRALVPFDFFAKHTEDHQAAYADCFGEGGRGRALDAQLAALIGIPEHYLTDRRNYRQNLDAIDDPEQRTRYTICYHIADAVSELSDCHHSTFRRIERWIYAIGTLVWDSIPTREAHAEGIRLGRTLFGYALGLDRWLQGVPMHFLLLDLSHVDLGLDPKNEILRVYAYLGEDRTPVKRWLAACLWFNLTLMPPASLYKWGWRHKELLARADEQGISVRAWMDAQLGG